MQTASRGGPNVCPVVSHGEYADSTDRRTDTRPLHYTSARRAGLLSHGLTCGKHKAQI